MLGAGEKEGRPKREWPNNSWDSDFAHWAETVRTRQTQRVYGRVTQPRHVPTLWLPLMRRPLLQRGGEEEEGNLSLGRLAQKRHLLSISLGEPLSLSLSLWVPADPCMGYDDTTLLLSVTANLRR